jgi:NADH-quinone oxidoreductase subunit L
MGGEQDMRRMGALKDKIPITHWTMWVGSVAIAGIPGLAGFFSKDEILWQAYSSPLGSKLLWFVGLATAGLTAFYMWRLMNMTFYGKSHVAPEVQKHVHESPATMTVPLTLLAIGSVLAGWLGTPRLWNLPESFRAFERWLQPAFASPRGSGRKPRTTASLEWMLMGLSVAVAIIGIAIARYFYHTNPKSRIPSKGPSSRCIPCSTTNGTWMRSTTSSS